MGIFNRSKVPSADAARLQGGDHTTGYTFTAQINDLNAELREAREQVAAKDAALNALDEAHQITQQGLWQDITELRASLAGKEQEHQDFRLQNDAEWRAKLDHLKAQIAAKDAEIKHLTEALERRGEIIFGREGD